MKIKLKSDFHDYYDHHFCGSHETPDWLWNRMSRDSLRKRDQFSLLEKLGFHTPTHGVVKDWVEAYQWDKLDPNQRVVVYLDELAHAGEGKILVSPAEAIRNFSDYYASVWIPTALNHDDAESYRLLFIGDRGWILKYTSTQSWQSNSGSNVCITLERPVWINAEFQERFSKLRHYPIFAIDSVLPYAGTQKFAIDFNSAPGLRGTPLEKTLSAKGCFGLIRDWIEKLHR